MDVLGGVLLYAGLVAILFGLWRLVRRRRRGWTALAGGILSIVAGVSLPIRMTRIEAAATRLDEFAPEFQWREFHETVVAAPRARVDAAIRSVTPEEIRGYRLLTWVRRFGRQSRPGALNPTAGAPILQTFTSTGFHLAADEPGREILLTVAGKRGEVEGKIGFKFRIEEIDPARCRVTTETRVYARGASFVRTTAVYWRLIYPGSALIRRSWLRAIKNRAETVNSDLTALI
jgi:hypothetical protein